MVTTGGAGNAAMYLFSGEIHAPTAGSGLTAPWSEGVSGPVTYLGNVTGNDNMLLSILNAATTASVETGTLGGAAVHQVADISTGWHFFCTTSFDSCEVGDSTNHQTFYSGYTDFVARTAPSNPASGNYRVYGDIGTGYLACLASTGGPCFAPTTHDFGTTWGDTSAALALSSGSVVYLTVPFPCTIQAWNMSVDAGTATVDIWKIATGTAIPTVTNSITASALPAISTGTSKHSTSMSGWTQSVNANDIFGFQLNAVSTARFVEVDLECR